MTKQELQEAAQWCWAYDLNVLAYSEVQEKASPLSMPAEAQRRELTLDKVRRFAGGPRIFVAKEVTPQHPKA